MLTDIATIECEVLLLADVTNSELLGAPLLFKGTFTFSNCNLGCSIAPSGHVLGETLKVGTEEASTSYEFEMLVSCPLIFNLHCIYIGAGIQAASFGPFLSNNEMPTGETLIEMNELEKVAGGSPCPEQAELDFLLGPLVSTYIRA